MSKEEKTISRVHLLPCDFIVGHVHFRKGVELETVRAAAERWLKIASDVARSKMDPETTKKLRELLDKAG